MSVNIIENGKLKKVSGGAGGTDDLATVAKTGDYEDLTNKPTIHGGTYINSTAPSDTTLFWIDTANGGILKYHNGTSWIPVKAVWG